MFEREITAIIETARYRIPHSLTNPHAYMMRDILAADIPYPLKTFFRADVEFMLAEELRLHRSNSRFNFDHPEVLAYQTQINSILVLSFMFDEKEFSTRLNDAVHLLINYLVRPQWTLTGVIFEKSSTISVSSLAMLMRYFSPYEYFRELMLRFLQERSISSVSKENFAEILRKVDGEHLLRKTGAELSKIVSPLYDFLDYPMNAGTKAIPTKALIRYFKDKGMKTAFDQMETELAGGRNAILRHELGEILESVRRTSGAFEIEPLTNASALHPSGGNAAESPTTSPAEETTDGGAPPHSNDPHIE